jgi:Domain of unknown function (DUF4349)
MSTHSAIRRWPAALTAIALLAFVLVGCAAQSDTAAQGDAGAGAPAASDGQEPSASRDRDDGQSQDGVAAPIEQRIVKTGEVGLEVDSVAVILAQVRAMALEMGGYVGGSQAGTQEQTASVTLRVPADRFDELITRLQELPDVELMSMSTREEDVTRQIVDLDARIRNLEASEASYRALLERAERIEDVLTVQGRLDEVRGQIEQLEAQVQTIEGQAALSTLTVTIIPREEPVAEVQSGWDPGAQATSAVATLVGIGQGLFDALTWIVIVVLPIAVVGGLITLAVMRLLPEARRRVMPVATDASGDSPTS